MPPDIAPAPTPAAVALVALSTDPYALPALRSVNGLPCAKCIGRVDGALAVVSSYGKESRWRVAFHRVATFPRFCEVLDALASSGRDIVIRGSIDLGEDYDPALGVLRRLTGSPQGGGLWTAAARAWVPIDFDGVEIPADLVTASPADQMLDVAERLPPAFRGRSFWFQFTSSHGLGADLRRLRVRMWFLADGPIPDSALVFALAPYCKSLAVDVSVYRPVQPVYIACPTFVDGVVDPVPMRTGIVEAFDDMLAASDFAAASAAADASVAGRYFHAARGGVEGHPVEIRNAVERVLASSTTGSRHSHALGAACELLALGADVPTVATTVEQLIRKQGRDPAPGEVRECLAWAIAKHAAGEVKVERVSAAAILPATPDTPPPPVDPPGDGFGGGDGDDNPGGAPSYSANANTNATAYLAAHYPAPKGAGYRYTYVRIGEIDYAWNGTHYAAQEDEALGHSVQVAVRVTVDATAKAIRRCAFHPLCAVPFFRQSMPLDPTPGMLVPFVNGVLNLSDWLLTGAATLAPPSPRLFTPTVIPYAFDPAAKCPAFDAWLAALFDDEDSRVEFVKMLGYLFHGENPLHRMFLLWGLPRSGKGVTLSIARGLVGSNAYAAASLESLGSRFGLQSLVGKRVIGIGEMNDGKATTTDRDALDRIKMISGGDTLAIDRKNRDVVDVALGGKLMIACNDFPRLIDASGALVDRMSVFKFRRGYAGREDTDLGRRLLGELPGIANRALAGLRLVMVEGFKTPAAIAEVMASVRRRGSPLLAFVEDCLVLDASAPTAFVSSRDIFNAYRGWAADHGIAHTYSLDVLRDKIEVTCPALTSARAADASGTRTRGLSGGGFRLSDAGLSHSLGNSPGGSAF